MSENQSVGIQTLGPTDFEVAKEFLRSGLLEAAVHSSGRLGVNYQSPFMLCQAGPSTIHPVSFHVCVTPGRGRSTPDAGP